MAVHRTTAGLLVSAIVALTTSVSAFSAAPLDTALAPPAPFTPILHPQPPSHQLISPSLAKPYPTNRWWQNLIVGKGDQPVDTLPYITRVSLSPKEAENGLQVSLPPKMTTEAYVSTWFAKGLTIGAAGVDNRFVQQQVTAHDLLTVSVDMVNQYGAVTNTTLTRGQPYTTVQYSSSLLPRLNAQTAVLQVNGIALNGATHVDVPASSRLQLTLNNGETILVYTSAALRWKCEHTQIYAVGASSASIVLRAAIVAPTTPQLTDHAIELLDRHSAVYPVGGSVNSQIVNGQSLMTLQWHTATMPAAADRSAATTSQQMLGLTLPHHRDIAVNAAYNALTYESVKGKMVGWTGNVLQTAEPFADIGFAPRYPLADGSKKETIRRQLHIDAASVVATAGDPYSFGKEASKMARLVLIADELGEHDTAAKLRQRLVDALTPWLEGTNGNALHYDTQWGGIVSTNGLADAGADFGNGWYNDHYYHYGYFCYAIAAVLHGGHYRDWSLKHRSAIVALVRDIANPSAQDAYFPQLRHFDPYMSHSWAAGLFAFGDARNQESTSEAVNAWYGVYLLGAALGHQEMRDTGLSLLTSELRGTHKYWHMTSNDSVYGEPFSSLKCVGQVWGSKIVDATWFAAGLVFVHGIQMLPTTPATELLLPYNWVAEQWPVLEASFAASPPPQEWLGIAYSDLAVIEPERAWDGFLQLTSFDNGATLTNYLHWVATRPQAAAVHA